MTKKLADLRICAAWNCMWVFKLSEHNGDPSCPKCKYGGYGSYGARFVLGNKAYRVYQTQSEYLKAKMFEKSCELDIEVDKEHERRKALKVPGNRDDTKRLLPLGRTH